MATFVYIDGGAATPPSLSYRTSATDASDLTTYTFTSKDIGTAGSNRHVVVGISSTQASGTPTISSVTIGGVTATIAVQVTGATRGVAGIAIAAVPSGATGNIVVTFGAGMSRCSIGVWAAYDLTSITAATTASSAVASGSMSLNMNVVTGDLVFAAAYDNGDAFPTTSTMAFTGITEQYDAVDGDGATYAGAHYLALSTETPRTISVIASPSTGRGAAAAAVFR